MEDVADMVEKALPGVVVVFDKGSFGSGFFVTRNGDILTNYHVVDGMKNILILTHSGRTYPARLRAYDDIQDIALLSSEIPASEYAVLNFVAAPPRIGTAIYAIGAPRGLDKSVSNGLVSQLRGGQDARFLQISAPISGGSSGGPVLNSKGEVVAMATAYLMDAQNLNFAVPAESLKKFLQTAGNNRYASTKNIDPSTKAAAAPVIAQSSLPSLPAPEKGFVRVATDEYGNLYDIDVYSIRRNGRVVQFWMNTTLGKKDGHRLTEALGAPRNTKVKNVRQLCEIEMNGQQYRYLKVIFEGEWKEYLNDGTTKPVWKNIVPGSAMDDLYAYLLKNHSR